MNKIIINPRYCTREEYQELKDYLNFKTWDWQEISSGEKVKPKPVGVFGYSNDDVHLEQYAGYFDIDSQTEAKAYAEDVWEIMKSNNECGRIEVWISDENGLFGNSGEPIFKITQATKGAENEKI